MRSIAPVQARIIEDMRDTLPDDAIVVSGVTNIGYWSNIFFEVRQQQTYITSGYFGTLGYAFPTALGAQVGRPDRKVVALCGDGGFMYSPQELSSALRHGINAVAVVFNNGAFGASEWDQTHRYGGNFIGTDLHNPDFVRLAESFGAVGMRTEPEGICRAARDCAEYGRAGASGGCRPQHDASVPDRGVASVDGACPSAEQGNAQGAGR